MAVIVVLAASPMALAQRAGFQIGISQPAVALPPVQAPAIATRGTFIGNPLPIEAGPVVIIQNQLIAPNPVFIPNQVLAPTPFFAPTPGFTTNPAFLPNPVFTTAPGVISGPFVFPGQVSAINQMPSQVTVPEHILVPGQTVIASPTAGPIIQPQVQSTFGPPLANKQVTHPAPGTTRADVIRQFGQPSVTVTTRTGETLYFDGGRTIITLENGQVSGPK
ncbi:MAG: hypothetical protein DMG18_09605 [Acidobacteria bacterium]|nr:MAG: hypothetical protein DMG18_09605 [Acidobacteriota bacterium]